jgi:hypothetical protein
MDATSDGLSIATYICWLGMMCIISKGTIPFSAQVEEQEERFLQHHQWHCIPDPSAIPMHSHTPWTRSNVWSQLAPIPVSVLNIGDKQSEKTCWNSDLRGICNAMGGIQVGHWGICHRGVSNVSGEARTWWPSCSAWSDLYNPHVHLWRLVIGSPVQQL